MDFLFWFIIFILLTFSVISLTYNFEFSGVTAFLAGSLIYCISFKTLPTYFMGENIYLQIIVMVIGIILAITLENNNLLDKLKDFFKGTLYLIFPQLSILFIISFVDLNIKKPKNICFKFILGVLGAICSLCSLVQYLTIGIVLYISCSEILVDTKNIYGKYTLILFGISGFLFSFIFI